MRLLFLVVPLVTACGGRTYSTETPYEEPPPVSDVTPPPDLTNASDLMRLNAEARRGAVLDFLHGEQVEDPFRALETDSELTRRWMDFQTERTERELTRWTRPEMEQRIRELLSIPTLGGAALTGNVLFFTRRDPGREQPALLVRSIEAGASPRVVVDPQTFGERAALDWYFPSPRGRYLAYGISDNGDERSLLRVLEVESGRALIDVIPHTKWTDVTWLHDETGFYYRRYPREGEADFDPDRQDAYHARLFFHALGADPEADVLVFDPEGATDFPSASVSDDDRFVVINNSRGWSESDVYLLDRGQPAQRIAPDIEHPLLTVIAGEPHLTSGRVHRGRLYLTTNLGAPRTRIAAVDPGNAGVRDAWRDVVPEGSAAIETWDFAGDRIAVQVVEEVRSRVLVYRITGEPDGEVTLPGRGEVFGLDGDPDSGQLAIAFSSFVHAPAIHLWSPADRALRTVAEVNVPVDLRDLELTWTRVTSRDGTPIHVTMLAHRHLVRDGDVPVLLTGYGGFNISLLPGFARSPIYWAERGGIYAVANLRGGGENGETWHRAGNLGNKERVFEDMEAVIRSFTSTGVTRPRRIAITGGSNGGLLMGAMITRCPETFAAAGSYVGLYDMLRYHHFPPAELWVTEYGSSEDAEQFRWLRAYSPYHRVRDRHHLPAILIETADHDTRVHWGHSTKFAARLQEASGETDPEVWFYRERQVGHGAGTRLSDLVRRYVRMYAFLEHVLEVPQAGVR